MNIDDRETLNDRIPVLETWCSHCNGNGFIEAMYTDDCDPCYICKGAGYIVTEYGKRILAMVQHQSRATVSVI